MSDSENNATALMLDHVYHLLEIREMFTRVLTPDEQLLLPPTSSTAAADLWLELIHTILNT